MLLSYESFEQIKQGYFHGCVAFTYGLSLKDVENLVSNVG